MRVVLLLGACLLAGCIADAPIEGGVLPAAQVATAWHALSYVTGEGALRVDFEVESTTVCEVTLVSHQEQPPSGHNGDSNYWPTFRIWSNDNIIGGHGISSFARDYGVRAGGMETHGATDHVWHAKEGNPDDRTYPAVHRIDGNFTFAKGMGKLTIQANAGFAPGPQDLALGASAVAALDCNASVKASAFDDDEALRIDGGALRWRETDQYVNGFWGANRYVGELNVTTNGPETEVTVVSGRSSGELWAKGAFNDTLAWNHESDTPPTIRYVSMAGPSGNLTIHYDLATVGPGFVGFQVRSWQPIKPVAATLPEIGS